MTLEIGQTYTTAQRCEQSPPPCLNCGDSTAITITWRDATVGEVMDRVWTLVGLQCRACAGSPGVAPVG